MNSVDGTVPFPRARLAACDTYLLLRRVFLSFREKVRRNIWGFAAAGRGSSKLTRGKGGNRTAGGNEGAVARLKGEGGLCRIAG